MNHFDESLKDVRLKHIRQSKLDALREETKALYEKKKLTHEAFSKTYIQRGMREHTLHYQIPGTAVRNPFEDMVSGEDELKEWEKEQARIMNETENAAASGTVETSTESDSGRTGTSTKSNKSLRGSPKRKSTNSSLTDLETTARINDFADNLNLDQKTKNELLDLLHRNKVHINLQRSESSSNSSTTSLSLGQPGYGPGLDPRQLVNGNSGNGGPNSGPPSGRGFSANSAPVKARKAGEHTNTAKNARKDRIDKSRNGGNDGGGSCGGSSCWLEKGANSGGLSLNVDSETPKSSISTSSDLVFHPVVLLGIILVVSFILYQTAKVIRRKRI